MKAEISPTALRDELKRQLGEISPLTPMVEGEESRVFAFCSGSDDFVVRVNRSAEGFRKDAFAYRCFGTAELPIPEVLLMRTLDDGNAYCVSRRIPGVTLQELLPSQLGRLLEPVALVMNAIADADVTMTSGFGPLDPTGIGRYATWRDFLVSVADPDRYDWSVVPGRTGRNRVSRFLHVIGELADCCPETRKLVHGDFGSNNVLAAGDRVTGVIDWSEALAGDPLYDVANILFWRSWLDCMEQQARYFEAQRPELLRHVERLRCYQLRIGVEEIHQSASAGDERLVSWAIARCDEIAGDGHV